MLATKITKPKAENTASSAFGLLRSRSAATQNADGLVAQDVAPQRAVGNQATLSRDLDSQILTAPHTTRGVALDFASIPIFAPHRSPAPAPPAALPTPPVVQSKRSSGRVDEPSRQHVGCDFSRVPAFAKGETIRETAERGASGGGEPLPYLAEIQRAFGRHDVRNVCAYQGSSAAAAARAIGARAYTIGERVAFGGSPDLRTAAHEAAHAVQQRAGVRLSGGVGEDGDTYERHADAVADQVARGGPAEALLDRMAPAGSRSFGMPQQAVQRAAISTNFGDFDTAKYDALGPTGREYGVDIELTFEPDKDKVDARKIGLTQTARSQLAGAAVAIEPSRRDRLVASGTGEGREIDRTTLGAYADPLYNSNVPGAKYKLGDAPPMSNAQYGWNYKDQSGALKHHIAKLIDTPKLPGHGNNAAQTFETAALAVEGAQSGVYMGSVSWGWSVDGAGKFSKLPLSLVAKGNPSPEFKAAAKQWNKWTAAGTIKTTSAPTNVYDAAYSVAFTVAKGTQVTVTGPSDIKNDLVYSPIRIAAGPHSGMDWRIKVTDLKDVGGGKPSIDLPIKEQPKPGTEARGVEKAVKVRDYATAYQILNGQWIKPMLPTLSRLNKKGLLPLLYSHTDEAEGVDLPRLRVAIEAVQFKENKTPLSQEFKDWIDPAKNARKGEIDEIKRFIGMK
ncbi:eCIS core domain-containing protein [Paraburkholderia acidiphila]|nr:DUF4157 domain-containing protein [Paraburkholderia acidiphila]